MFRHLFAIVLLAFALAAPAAQAQINWDIPTTETPGGDPGGDRPDGPAGYCHDCCTNAIWDPTCCDACGCQCGMTPLCPSYSAMRSSGAALSTNVAVLKSVAETQKRMLETPRGKKLVDVWVDQSRQVTEIFETNPELAARIGKALVTYWPWDMWTNTGAKSHRVSENAMRELREILGEVAKADRAMGGTVVAPTIRDAVLPRLTRGLVGRPYHEALACFVAEKDCP